MLVDSPIAYQDFVVRWLRRGLARQTWLAGVLLDFLLCGLRKDELSSTEKQVGPARLPRGSRGERDDKCGGRATSQQGHEYGVANNV